MIVVGWVREPEQRLRTPLLDAPASPDQGVKRLSSHSTISVATISAEEHQEIGLHRVLLEQSRAEWRAVTGVECSVDSIADYSGLGNRLQAA